MKATIVALTVMVVALAGFYAGHATKAARQTVIDARINKLS